MYAISFRTETEGVGPHVSVESDDDLLCCVTLQDDKICSTANQ